MNSPKLVKMHLQAEHSIRGGPCFHYLIDVLLIAANTEGADPVLLIMRMDVEIFCRTACATGGFERFCRAECCPFAVRCR